MATTIRNISTNYPLSIPESSSQEELPEIIQTTQEIADQAFSDLRLSPIKMLPLNRTFSIETDGHVNLDLIFGSSHILPPMQNILSSFPEESQAFSERMQNTQTSTMDLGTPSNELEMQINPPVGINSTDILDLSQPRISLPDLDNPTDLNSTTENIPSNTPSEMVDHSIQTDSDSDDESDPPVEVERTRDDPDFEVGKVVSYQKPGQSPILGTVLSRYAYDNQTDRLRIRCLDGAKKLVLLSRCERVEISDPRLESFPIKYSKVKSRKKRKRDDPDLQVGNVVCYQKPGQSPILGTVLRRYSYANRGDRLKICCLDGKDRVLHLSRCSLVEISDPRLKPFLADYSNLNAMKERKRNDPDLQPGKAEYYKKPGQSPILGMVIKRCTRDSQKDQLKIHFLDGTQKLIYLSRCALVEISDPQLEQFLAEYSKVKSMKKRKIAESSKVNKWLENQ